MRHILQKETQSFLQTQQEIHSYILIESPTTPIKNGSDDLSTVENRKTKSSKKMSTDLLSKLGLHSFSERSHALRSSA